MWDMYGMMDTVERYVRSVGLETIWLCLSGSGFNR